VLVALATLAGVPAAVAAQNPAAKKLNPYTGDPNVVLQGRKLFLKYGCSGCHGVGGGGGMGPPLIDDVWHYGSDDETLFKIVTGQIEESKMPKNFREVLTDDEVWRILAYVRSQYAGDPAKADW
jgi:cytochrome c(L)